MPIHSIKNQQQKEWDEVPRSVLGRGILVRVCFSDPFNFVSCGPSGLVTIKWMIRLIMQQTCTARISVVAQNTIYHALCSSPFSLLLNTTSLMFSLLSFVGLLFFFLRAFLFLVYCLTCSYFFAKSLLKLMDASEFPPPFSVSSFYLLYAVLHFLIFLREYCSVPFQIKFRANKITFQ